MAELILIGFYTIFFCIIIKSAKNKIQRKQRMSKYIEQHRAKLKLIKNEVDK